ncbi:flagellin lysine-N-methylase [Craterilacuibacter sp. RT1T]|uniref:flagellin lysine-N-methylase n=1 Tax=Craterilacuibacter sp. RT1T TaxID=2942211 RepID=UPI0020BD66DF|nr:flagellin lysine-N-methylase [Craterilacuibacter sp. RT1T]MCL6261815.1 flagellin lysine-N-methylase [Craterilacuibacter sp. RT1T]
MITTTRDMLVPAYLGKFSCLGPACPDTCCYGWSVAVEHDSYRRLKNLPDPELKPLIAQALKRGQGKSGSADFGFLAVGGADGRCPLLSGEGLCQLHARCGEVVLPNICATYPRITIEAAGHYVQTASPSCPEVARLLVEDAGAVQLTIEQRTVRPRMVSSKTGGEPNENVRVLYLGVLGSQDIPLWQRLGLLLLIAESVDAARVAPVAEGVARETEIQRVLDEWQYLLASGDAMQAVALWRRDDDLHLQLMAALSRLRTRWALTRQRYCELVGEAAAGWDSGVSAESALADADLDAVLGRVLYNHALGHYMPLAPESSLFANTVLLCTQYLSLRFWWAGLALARDRALNAPEQAELLANYYREVIHSPTYLTECVRVLGEVGFAKAEHWLRVLPA